MQDYAIALISPLSYNFRDSNCRIEVPLINDEVPLINNQVPILDYTAQQVMGSDRPSRTPLYVKIQAERAFHQPTC
jgi:hypothetical protein